ncbi:NADPH:quinone oxidoreductase family protein [Bradyrhizobium cajani]|uniref:Zinc-binding dehydrogenase n=1 Tax=Bradyrhizobium cajani TaxID=1928661 RepID=A0A844TQ58_9BRAD|nr:NADPH:quinone oxidoreductase family protein [Bradyrhizobium cajani]MCP3371113.1 NADPH:quinone oxidoreductase family protein [Bradyrhizobium cajani]MVT77392.1 zinc-binding dehydrogenase [Bradyrhizobium cajani]
MRAVVVENYDRIENIAIKDVAKPDISAGMVRVRIQAAAVGFVDGLKVQGLYQTKDPLPFTPGSEFAGVVDEAASDVSGFAPGTPVLGMVRNGGLAQYVCAPAADLFATPDGIAPEVGASFFANYLTALYALSARAKLRSGETLLVLGAAGGVGIAAVQVGKLLGARVIAAASTEEKRQFATKFGADSSLDYTREGWRDELKELTGGEGADVIFDPVGGELSLQAFRSIAWNGRHLVVGFASGTIPALKFNLPLLKGGALLGVDLAQIGRREPEVRAEVIAQLFTWLSEKTLVPVVGRVFPFERFHEAFAAMATRSALGKMVVRID